MTVPDPEPDPALLPDMERQVWQDLPLAVRTRLALTAKEMVENNPLLNVEAALRQLIRDGIAGRSYQEGRQPGGAR